MAICHYPVKTAFLMVAVSAGFAWRVPAIASVENCVNKIEVESFVTPIRPDELSKVEVEENYYKALGPSNKYSMPGTTFLDELIVNIARPNFKLVYPIFSVRYKLNRSGLRAPDGADISPRANMILIGGRNVFGQGLDTSNTLSGLINRIKLSEDFAVNMGFLGLKLNEIKQRLQSIQKNLKYREKDIILVLENSILSGNPEKDMKEIEAMKALTEGNRFTVVPDPDLSKENRRLFARKIGFDAAEAKNWKNPKFFIPFSKLRSARGNLILACRILEIARAAHSQASSQ